MLYVFLCIPKLRVRTYFSQSILKETVARFKLTESHNVMLATSTCTSVLVSCDGPV